MRGLNKCNCALLENTCCLSHWFVEKTKENCGNREQNAAV